MGFSYYLEFYKRNIFNLDTDEDSRLLKESGEQALKIEQYFLESILNIDELRSTIIQSYIFERELDIKNRIDYIRGIIYSKKYINMNDLKSFSKYLQKSPTKHVYDSIFFDMGYAYNKFEFIELMLGDINDNQINKVANIIRWESVNDQNSLVLVGDNVFDKEDEKELEKDKKKLEEDKEDIADEEDKNLDNVSEIFEYSLIDAGYKLTLFREYYETFKILC